ncbi:MAG: hypothetical protein HS116_25375 [Planctomycetes bacterium]|nr:hypothetical protein [Planctomycetota bacterium]
MRTFKDNAGRTWTVSVDVDAIRRVRTALQVNLASAELAQVLERLLSDPVLLCDVLFVVCKPEADKLGVSDVDFGRAMAGDAIEAGTLALLEELANFTPNPRDRARVKRLLQAMQQLAERTRDAAETRLEREIEKALSATTATSGPSSGSSPGSSASIPVP